MAGTDLSIQVMLGSTEALDGAALVTQLVKDPPAMLETWVQSPGREDLLEESLATYCSILAWRVPVDRGVWQAAVHGVTQSGT